MIKLMNTQTREAIIDLYKHGNSSIEITEMLDLPISVRQVQRIIKKAKATRNPHSRYQLAVDKGRMDYEKKAKSIRYCPHCNHKLW